MNGHRIHPVPSGPAHSRGPAHRRLAAAIELHTHDVHAARDSETLFDVVETILHEAELDGALMLSNGAHDSSLMVVAANRSAPNATLTHGSSWHIRGGQLPRATLPHWDRALSGRVAVFLDSHLPPARPAIPAVLAPLIVNGAEGGLLQLAGPQVSLELLPIADLLAMRVAAKLMDLRPTVPNPAAEGLYESIFRSDPGQLTAFDASLHVRATNQVSRFTDPQTSAGQHLDVFLPASASPELSGAAESVLHSGRGCVIETCQQGIGEAPRWTANQLSPHRDSRGQIVGVILRSSDITRSKATERALAAGAMHDLLTGLPNRALFRDRLDHALARCVRDSESGFAVFFIDVDRLQVINDSLGHDMGDRLLAELANRLRAAVQRGDTVSRFGGDAFTLLMEGIVDAPTAAAVATRLQRRLGEPVYLDEHELFISVSVGIRICNTEGPRGEDVLRDADTAMCQAKAAGGAQSRLFDAPMHARITRRLQLDSQLRRALEREELRVYYQPVVDLDRGTIGGFEALVRWQHPEHGLVPPMDFIGLAEETGIIRDIGAWVLSEACDQLTRWDALGLQSNALDMAVNISGRQLADDRLTREVQETLSRTGIPPNRLTLEVTETVMTTRPDQARKILEGLRATGVSISIDDFGTGYSSLSQLHRFPFSHLKIDRSFVWAMHEPGSAGMVSAIVNMANSLGMSVVAEGIETDQHLAALRALGCERAQGYLFAKPLPAHKITDLLQRNPRW